MFLLEHILYGLIDWALAVQQQGGRLCTVSVSTGSFAQYLYPCTEQYKEKEGWNVGSEEEEIGRGLRGHFTSDKPQELYASGVRLLKTVLSSAALKTLGPLLHAICSKWGLLCSNACFF